MHIYNEKMICVLITTLLLNDEKTLTKENDFQSAHNVQVNWNCKEHDLMKKGEKIKKSY